MNNRVKDKDMKESGLNNKISSVEQKEDQSIKDQKLSMQIESYIDGKINFAFENANAVLAAEIKGELSKQTFSMRMGGIALTVVSFVVGFAMWFVAPTAVRQWTEDFVVQRMNQPALEEAAEKAIKEKMELYVANKFEPIKEEVSSLDQFVNSLNKQITVKQDEMLASQAVLRNQLNIQHLMLTAKAGSWSSYDALIKIASNDNKLHEYAKAAIKDIELHFDGDRNQLSYIVLVDGLSLKDPGYSVEETIYLLRKRPELREAAVNTLSRLKRKTVVNELCGLLRTETNLRIAARITRAISEISGARINPLAFNEANQWCSQNQDKPEYGGSYEGYFNVRDKINGKEVKWEDIPSFLPLLDETIQSDEVAIHARCLKGGFLVLLGNINEAKVEFEEVERVKSDYVWLKFWRSALFLKENQKENAIQSMNEALEKSPLQITFAAKFWNIFQPLHSEEMINWPSQSEAFAGAN